MCRTFSLVENTILPAAMAQLLGPTSRQGPGDIYSRRVLLEGTARQLFLTTISSSGRFSGPYHLSLTSPVGAYGFERRTAVTRKWMLGHHLRKS